MVWIGGARLDYEKETDALKRKNVIPLIDIAYFYQQFDSRIIPYQLTKERSIARNINLCV